MAQNEAPKVAGNAKRGEPDRKARARLDRRVFDFNAMMADSRDPTGRKGSGGYHKPGSMQR